MPYRRWLSVAALTGFLLLYTLTPYLEPYFVQRTSETAVTGFFGIEWETSLENVELYMQDFDAKSQHLQPSLRDGLRPHVLLYRTVEVLDLSTKVGFFFDENQRLTMGFFLVPFDVEHQDCKKIYDVLREKIEQQYGGLSTVQNRRNPLDAPLCNAIVLGSAGKTHHWADPGSLAQIQLKMGFGVPRHVLMVTASPQFMRWLNRHNLEPSEVIQKHILPDVN